jgi:hypothetical protein
LYHAAVVLGEYKEEFDNDIRLYLNEISTGEDNHGNG